ncbi:MAG: hypothetical protein WAN34_06675 [Acidimicrobiia bacterium]
MILSATAGTVVFEQEEWMKIQSGQLVALGYGAYVRSDDVIAVEPITDGRGPGRRTFVWVRGISDPLVASRAEGSIVDDLITPADEAARMKAQRSVLQRMATVLDTISPGIRRLLAEESGKDIEELSDEAKRVLG